MAKSGSNSLTKACDAIHETERVLSLSIRGISQLSRSVELFEAVTNVELFKEEIDPVVAARQLENNRVEAEFAQQEVDKGFPVLHAHAVVAIWGILEATIEDIVLELIESDESCFENPLLASIKVPLAEYERLDKTDRIRLLVTEYSRNTKVDLKLGAARFETLLELVGLSGGIKDGLRRDLLEYQQVRNVIVHRAGRADRRLLECCPWLEYSVGDSILIIHKQYECYRDAAMNYLVELVVRLFVRKGFSREEAEAKVRSNRKVDQETQATLLLF